MKKQYDKTRTENLLLLITVIGLLIMLGAIIWITSDVHADNHKTTKNNLEAQASDENVGTIVDKYWMVNALCEMHPDEKTTSLSPLNWFGSEPSEIPSDVEIEIKKQCKLLSYNVSYFFVLSSDGSNFIIEVPEDLWYMYSIGDQADLY